MYLSAIVALTIFMALPDVWFYLKMKRKVRFKWLRLLSLLPLLLFVFTFFYIRYGLRHSHDFLLISKISWIFIAISAIYTPKIIFIVFYYVNRLYNRIFDKRTHIFRQIGFGLGVFFVGIIAYGVVICRTNFQLKKQVVEVTDLPESFDGYKIVLFADFHLGNWNRKYSIMEPIIEMINKTDADIIIFAGDLINNFHQETIGWEEYFRQLKSKDGMYAVLGNHDYGDYTNWQTPEHKAKNLEQTKENIRSLSFRLLLNENTDLIKGNDTISLVGVENFGSVHFDNYADLKKALEGIPKERKKILISHDPNHWNAEIVDKRKDIFLTVSGHTHAGQMGFVRGNFKISPAALIYPEWDGLYSSDEQHIYVNRGIGYVGIPMRIGVPPEITLITLKKKEK